MHSTGKSNQIVERIRRAPPALLLLAAVFFMMSGCRTSPETKTQNSKSMTNSPETTNDPLSIHRRAIVIDMHADPTQRLVDENVDLELRLIVGHLDAVRA